MITYEELIKELEYDYISGEFRWIKEKKKRNLQKSPGNIKKSGNTSYLIICIDGKDYRAHRLAWLYHYGKWPNGFIDHINGNGLDNRIDNLRESTNSENLRNRGKQINNTSGYKGVTYQKSRNNWLAQIRVNGKNKNLGRFNCPTRAFIEYCKAAKKLHKEFSNIGI